MINIIMSLRGAKRRSNLKQIASACGLAMTLLFSSVALAQDSVEINGDVVEYSVDGNTITAKGNVEIRYRGAKLFADEADFSRLTNIAHAKGNVRLLTDQGEVLGETLTFDYNTMQGDFNMVTMVSPPYYGGGRYVGRINENQIVIRDGYASTSDFDNPETRISAKKIEIDPGNKLVARSVKLKLGKVPLFYIPKYTQNLKDRRPSFYVIPGRSKEWGEYLLGGYNFYIDENLKGTVHLDYRTKLGLAEGFDVDYKNKNYGQGIFRTYYAKERRISADHFWEERDTPTVERQKYKVEWRHKWDIDKTTTAVAQYYKITDPNFLKDYFENEFKKDSNPETYFLLTKAFPYGTLGLRSDVRVNRYETVVERLPEVSYNLPGTEIYDSGFYWKSVSTVSNLTKEEPAPGEFRPKTVRMDTDNEISYPFKVSFVEFKPFIGTRETYYSRTAIPTKGDAFRSQLKTGVSASTKFYRVYDVQTDQWGMDINQLRHIITPSVSYAYNSEPTVDSSDLDFYDEVDAIQRSNTVILGLENKLQTKRDGKSVDLLRAIVEVDHPLNNDPLDNGFNIITTEVDFKPNDLISLYFDSSYDTRKDHLETANVDLYLNKDDKWRLGIGRRYAHDIDDIVSANLYYKINPKWKFDIYERVNIDKGEQQAFELILTRDLHSWEMDISFNEERGQGSEIMLIFRLKAFPDIGVNAGSNFNKRKPGSQSQ